MTTLSWKTVLWWITLISSTSGQGISNLRRRYRQKHLNKPGLDSLLKVEPQDISNSAIESPDSISSSVTKTQDENIDCDHPIFGRLLCGQDNEMPMSFTYAPSSDSGVIEPNPPSPFPTLLPARDPTGEPSQTVTIGPTLEPSLAASPEPTAEPTLLLTELPTNMASDLPTFGPSGTPTTNSPSHVPSVNPTTSSSEFPTSSPSPTILDETHEPTVRSTTLLPTVSDVPSSFPTVSGIPSMTPTITSAPTGIPSSNASRSPTITNLPTQTPTTSQVPTTGPTRSMTPSESPTMTPNPSAPPSASIGPSLTPSSSTQAPSADPSSIPTEACSVSDRETALFVALDAAFDVSLVQDPTTPQGAAFDWLLNTDVETDPCDTLQITQRYALAVLYESTGGIDWAVDDGWLSASPVCDWFEVDCADNETTIIQLTLFDNNLNGTLPEELAALKSLRNFNVFFNSLRGTIPDYFSAWPELILFDVENNTLSGEPFAWLDDSQRLNDDTGMLMPNLRFFRLSHNQFQGSITTNVARQLSSIQQLWIAGNKFTGQVPNEI